LLITELLVKPVIDALNVVLEANLALLVLLVTMDVLVNPVLLALPVLPEKHPHSLVPNKLHHHANHALLDHLVHLDLPDQLVMQDQMVNQEMEEAQPLPASQDLKDLQVLLDQMETLGLQGNPVHLLNQKELPQAHQDLLEMLDHLAHQDLLDNLETMVHLDNPDLKVPLVQMEILEAMANPVLLVKLDLPEVQEKRVSAPNIVLSMVVSSSKTELADKHLHILCYGVASDAFFSFNCNAHCHCCHASWLCKPLDRMQLNYFFVVFCMPYS